ncbi:MAG: hypothetical protein ACJAXX_001102 [Roseivirga sp.]|jgi:hypothetical protein
MENKLTELENKVRKGLEDSYKKLLEFKRQKNSPLIISKDGKIVELKISTKSNKGKL